MNMGKNRWNKIRKAFFARPASKGFTLIEIMVATAIFSVVMTIATGALLTIIDANRKSQSLKSVINNLNFALEDMSRNIRVGKQYYCEDQATPSLFNEPQLYLDCPNGGNIISFRPTNWQSGPPTTFWFDESGERKIIKKSVVNPDTGEVSFLEINAPEVVIESLRFYVTGSNDVDAFQPRVLMTVKGYAGQNEKTRSYFNLQTTISQRLLDKKYE